MALFAFTNGYAATLCMCYGPQLVDSKDKELAGFIMSVNLVGGIFLGSLVSTFGISKVTPKPTA